MPKLANLRRVECLQVIDDHEQGGGGLNAIVVRCRVSVEVVKDATFKFLLSNFQTFTFKLTFKLSKSHFQTLTFKLYISLESTMPL